jgi:hypothetical protein
MKDMLRFFTVIIFAFLIGSSCNNKFERNRHIYIKNNSNKSIYYRFSFAYPDTTLGESDPNNYIIISGEQVSTSASSFAYNPTLQMYFLDAGVVDTEPWDSIVVHYKVLKRYQFTEQDMKTSNWIITYP